MMALKYPFPYSDITGVTSYHKSRNRRGSRTTTDKHYFRRLPVVRSRKYDHPVRSGFPTIALYTRDGVLSE